MSYRPPALDPDDVALLLELYDAPDTEIEPRRPPWTWPALRGAERAALARLVDAWVYSYNHVHAITPTELIPPCWRQHPGLATELAVQLWLWYQAHLDPRTSIFVAADYYFRHLPAFRRGVDRLLGVSPGECRRGEHPASWRQDADQQLSSYTNLLTDDDHHSDDVEFLGELWFGFHD